MSLALVKGQHLAPQVYISISPARKTSPPFASSPLPYKTKANALVCPCSSVQVTVNHLVAQVWDDLYTHIAL